MYIKKESTATDLSGHTSQVTWTCLGTADLKPTHQFHALRPYEERSASNTVEER